jgi:hypothetical protein
MRAQYTGAALTSDDRAASRANGDAGAGAGVRTCCLSVCSCLTTGVPRPTDTPRSGIGASGCRPRTEYCGQRYTFS